MAAHVGSAAPTVAVLRDVAQAVAGGNRLGEVLQASAEAIVGHLGVHFARIWVLEPGAANLVLEASAGRYTHLDGDHSRIAVGAFKIGRIAAERAPHLTNSVADDPQVSDPVWAKAEGVVAFAGYPLLIGQQLVGVLGLFARHTLDLDTIEALATVSDALALGINRLQVEDELRLEALMVECLYEFGRAIVGRLDLAILAQLAIDLATKLVGAQRGSLSYVVDDDGVQRTLEAVSGPIGGPPAPCRLSVPVTSAAGDALGHLHFDHADADAFDGRTERLAVGIAGQAAAALDSARAYESEHRIAVRLQQLLLPRAPTSIPGAAVAVRYRPASSTSEVGGDWYDVSRLTDGTVALTIGDVVGHDLRAAVAMGQIRNAVRLHALDGLLPSDVLARVDDYMTKAGITELATAIQCAYDPVGRTLDLCRAGHPPPLLVRPGGEVSWPGEARLDGPLLGLGAHARTMTTLQLAEGDLLVLYTDGLIERRGESLDDGMARLAQTVLAAGPCSVDDLADRLLATLGTDDQGDDIAVVVMQVDPTATDTG